MFSPASDRSNPASPFSSDQWDILMVTPLLAGLTVACSHPSGFTGVKAELHTLRRCFEPHVDDVPLIALLKEGVKEQGWLHSPHRAHTGDLKTDTLHHLRQVRHWLSQPEHCHNRQHYQEFVGRVMGSVAGAALDGGLFSNPEGKVSFVEMDTMVELLQTLG